MSVTGNLTVTTGTLDLGAFTANRATVGRDAHDRGRRDAQDRWHEQLPDQLHDQHAERGEHRRIQRDHADDRVGRDLREPRGEWRGIDEDPRRQPHASPATSPSRAARSTSPASPPTGRAAAASLTVAAGATLRIGGTATLPSNYTTNTLNVASTVEYYGANQAVANATYGNLVLSGSGTKTGGTAVVVAGDFTNSGVTFAAGTATTFSGDFTNNGTFAPGANTVTFNGACRAADRRHDQPDHVQQPDDQPQRRRRA